MMRYLQPLYAMVCTVWTAHLIQMLAAIRPLHPEATLSGAVVCVLLLGVFPSLIGYVLLFRTVPWVGRLIRG